MSFIMEQPQNTRWRWRCWDFSQLFDSSPCECVCVCVCVCVWDLYLKLWLWLWRLELEWELEVKAGALISQQALWQTTRLGLWLPTTVSFII